MQLRRYDAKHSIRHNAVAIAAGTVYLIDRPLAMFDRSKSGRASAQGHPTGVLVALDAATGKVKWQKNEQIFGIKMFWIGWELNCNDSVGRQ